MTPMDDGRIERTLSWVLFLGAALGVACLCLLMLRPFAGVIAWSVVLAVICQPPHQALVRKTGRPTLSAFVTSVLAVVAFLVPLLLIAGIAISQGVAVADALRGLVQSPDQSVARASGAVAALTGRIGVDQGTITAWVHEHSAGWMRSAGQFAMSSAAGLLETLASSMFVAVALFLLLRDGSRIIDAIIDLLPFDRQRSRFLLRRIGDVVQASVYGTVVIALLHGAVYGTTFFVLGIRGAALWGMVTVFASAVPMVGAFAVWGPAAVYLAANGRWVHALVLALVAFLVSSVDHILRPRLVAGRVGISELAMFFALLGGLALFGPLGVVLGPVAFATLAVIIDILRERGPAAAADAGGRGRAA